MSNITRILGFTMFACIALVALVNCKPTSLLGTPGSGQAPTSTNEAVPSPIGTGGPPAQSTNITSTLPESTPLGNSSPPGASGNSSSVQPPAGNVTSTNGTVMSSDSPPLAPPGSEAAGISPAPSSTVCLKPEISVGLSLTDAVRTDGALDLSKIKLMLDGIDVTGKALVMGTLDFPQSQATITYTPDQPLAAGKHTASITTATPTGDKTYQWTFETADIPCQ